MICGAGMRLCVWGTTCRGAELGRGAGATGAGAKINFCDYSYFSCSAHINNVFLSFRLTWRDDPTLDLSRIKIQAFSDILCVLTLQYNCTVTPFHIGASKSCLFQRDNVLVRLLTYTTVTAKSKQNRHPWARQLGGALPVETWSGSDRPTYSLSIGRPLLYINASFHTKN